ncbi:MAG TPA: hypothetical protein PLA92_08570, partial [Fimbriimonadaceae bacterium]|nr:hypothetical protein [Fimbriimonadaceae bacterium]
NTNLMSAQIVRLKFNCPKVCIKVADPLLAEAYRKLGFFCITPSALTSGMMRDWLISEPYGTIDNYNLLPEELRI